MISCVVFEDVKKRIVDAVLDKQVNFFWVFWLGGFIYVLTIFCALLLVSELGIDLIGQFIFNVR